MPFLGVVHSDARKVLASLIPQLPKRVHIICSGNFTNETTLRQNGYQGEITGCDVSLFTSAIGAYLAGQDLEIELSASASPEFALLQPYMATPAGRAACVAVSFDLMKFLPRRNQFQRRMFQASMNRLPQLIESTIKKLEAKRETIQLARFHSQDGWVRAHEIPAGDDDLVCVSPPTYAGDYRKMYAALEQTFHWNPPQYKELVSGAVFTISVFSRPGRWIVFCE